IAAIDEQQSRANEIARFFGDLRRNATDGIARRRRAGRLQNAEEVIIERGDTVDDDVGELNIEFIEKTRREITRNLIAEERERGDVGTRWFRDRCFRDRNRATIEECVEVLEHARDELRMFFKL